MKQKTILLAAAAALLLGGCAKSVTLGDNRTPVAFGGYSPRTISKAGVTEDMNLEALKTYGFGVFATYTATDDFTAADNNFMFNQQVYHDGTAWTYSPIRYWPNPTDGQTASDQKVSFFAYAPYCDPGSAETVGITAFDLDGGHNVVRYIFAPDAPNVDLLWGYRTASDPRVPNADLTRSDGVVRFTFRHVLAKLGGSQEGVSDPDNPAYVANGLLIKASPTADPTDAYIAGTTGDFGTDTGTKITVSSIVLESAPETEGATAVTDALGNPVVYASLGQSGTLDLFSGSFSLDGTAQPVRFRQEIYARPTDAQLAAGASELADHLKEVPGVTDFALVNKGVVKQAVNVYKDETNPIILVPGTAPVVDVTITYVVRTYDPTLPAGFTEVPQTVFGRVKFPLVESNKKYNLCIILGLNDVSFEASVEDWASDTGVQDIGLPDNL